MNPFKSALVSTFAKEKEQAVRVANTGAISENEQLIWVLWKILKGGGGEVRFWKTRRRMIANSNDRSQSLRRRR